MRECHILVVDDDPFILDVLARWLTSQHVRVSTARRTSVARSVLMHDSPDLVIADARIPGENGIALALAAEEMGIPVIVMSGDTEWAITHGVRPEQFLAKPFDVHTLSQRIRAELALRPELDLR